MEGKVRGWIKPRKRYNKDEWLKPKATTLMAFDLKGPPMASADMFSTYNFKAKGIAYIDRPYERPGHDLDWLVTVESEHPAIDLEAAWEV